MKIKYAATEEKFNLDSEIAKKERNFDKRKHAMKKVNKYVQKIELIYFGLCGVILSGSDVGGIAPTCPSFENFQKSQFFLLFHRSN